MIVSWILIKVIWVNGYQNTEGDEGGKISGEQLVRTLLQERYHFLRSRPTGMTRLRLSSPSIVRVLNIDLVLLLYRL